MYSDGKIKSLIFMLVCLCTVAACSNATQQGSQGNEALFDGPESLTLTTSDGFTVFGYLHRPENKNTPDSSGTQLILAFHQGGASGEAEYAPIIPKLLKEGFAVMTIDQRRGGSKLDSPLHPPCHKTCLSASEHATICRCHRCF